MRGGKTVAIIGMAHGQVALAKALMMERRQQALHNLEESLTKLKSQAEKTTMEIKDFAKEMQQHKYITPVKHKYIPRFESR